MFLFRARVAGAPGAEEVCESQGVLYVKGSGLLSHAWIHTFPMIAGPNLNCPGLEASFVNFTHTLYLATRLLLSHYEFFFR